MKTEEIIVSEAQDIQPEKAPSESIQQQKSLAQIGTDDKGAMVAQNFEGKFRLARAYFASGIMPKGLNSVEKVLVAMEICSELNLPPMLAIGKIAVINQTPSLWGELPLGLVRKSGLLVTIKETWQHDEKGSVVGASCILMRRGESAVERTFTMDMARKAGLWGKTGPWTNYPERMFQMRARGWAIKDVFPDVLLGIAQAEYDFNAIVHPDGRIEGAITDQPNVANEINQQYLNNNEGTKSDTSNN